MSDSLMNTYARLPVRFVRGEGCYLWDNTGKRYLDAIAGIAVCSLGHARRDLAEAIYAQAKTLVHTSNLYHIPQQEALGERLCQLSGMDKVFFSNSGAEANEAAIKMARLYGHQQGVDQPTVIVMEHSFHGRTMATLSATGNPKVKAGFSPLVSGFVQVPYNDVAAIHAVAAENSNIVAVLVEPVQGEGGVNVPDKGYLSALRALCDQHDWLLMLDEIQTGLGRTGQWFAHQHENITPDVMTLAKALGNGMPIGACLAAGKASTILQAGTHGSTYGGNPLACQTALAVLDAMATENIPQRAADLGDYFYYACQEKLNDLSIVKNIRHKGCMIGIELACDDCSSLVRSALAKGLLINVTAGHTIRLLPPLVMSHSQANQVVDELSTLIDTFSQTLFTAK